MRTRLGSIRLRYLMVVRSGAADDGVDGREREARLDGDPAERHARLP
jgi:hypothetical protein